MNKVLYKFYDMETMTPEKLNDLALERNKFAKEIERLNNIIDKAIEYIENNSLYEQDYDYDYEENIVELPPDDEISRRILLGILKDSDEIE